jgi:hypothetical protein
MNRDIKDSLQLAKHLGEHVGVRSMVVSANGDRSAAVDVVREALNNPDAYVLLKDESNRLEFLRNLAFGMKEQVSRTPDRTELAADFGHWMARAWKELSLHRRRRGDSEGVVLFATHWLEKGSIQHRDPEKLRVWWQQLRPLLESVVSEGRRPDCFTLFFALRDGKYNDLARPEEFIELGETFIRRIRKALLDGSLILNERSTETEDWHTWGEIIEYLAEAIDSLRQDGSLQTDFQRERAHDLLSDQAAEPVRSSKALEALHRLQNE